MTRKINYIDVSNMSRDECEKVICSLVDKNNSFEEGTTYKQRVDLYELEEALLIFMSVCMIIIAISVLCIN